MISYLALELEICAMKRHYVKNAHTYAQQLFSTLGLLPPQIAKPIYWCLSCIDRRNTEKMWCIYCNTPQLKSFDWSASAHEYQCFLLLLSLSLFKKFRLSLVRLHGHRLQFEINVWRRNVLIFRMYRLGYNVFFSCSLAKIQPEKSLKARIYS